MFTTTVTPRVYETDGAGHVNNVFVPAWLEAGRRGIFRLLNPDLSFEDWHAVIVNMNVDYLRQIYLAADAQVRTSVEHVGTKSFRLHEEIWQEQRCCVTAHATYVYFDRASDRARPIPGDVRAALEAHRASR